MVELKVTKNFKNKFSIVFLVILGVIWKEK